MQEQQAKNDLRIVYFIIVNYNNSNITIDCIRSINNLLTIGTNFSVKCIVVDNGSCEYERNVLKEGCSSFNEIDVELLLIQNVGYFPAFNYALETIKDRKDITVILCNNDLLFESHFLQNYHDKKYPDDVFVVSPDITNKDGSHQNPHLINRFSLIRVTYYYLYYTSYTFAVILEYIASLLKLKSSLKNKKGFEQCQYITMGFGACYILPHVFFNHFSKLDAYTFLMGEEGMLSNQVLKNNGRIFYDCDLKVFHLDSSTFCALPSKKTYEYSKESFWKSRKYYKLRDLYDRRI